MEDKKFLKMEKEASAGRLQSLKLPRDLSLGLSKPKKQYTPNLNVVRNKDKTKEFLKKMEQKRKERSSNRDRFEKHDKGRFVQSAGVFSEGSAELKRTQSQQPVEKRASFRDSSSVSNIILPTINRNTWNVNKKAEDVVLDDLMNCEIDSDDDKMSFKPLTLSGDKDFINNDNRRVAIKKEEFDGTLNRYLLPEPFNGENLSEENPALSLVRLPNSFAGKGFSDDPNIKKLFDYPLSGMLEGEIGKLVIRKSGKMEVQIGRISYELNPENTFESREELVAIVGGEDSETNVAVLGQVVNNFVMFPDYETLLKKK